MWHLQGPEVVLHQCYQLLRPPLEEAPRLPLEALSHLSVVLDAHLHAMDCVLQFQIVKMSPTRNLTCEFHQPCIEHGAFVQRNYVLHSVSHAQKVKASPCGRTRLCRRTVTGNTPPPLPSRNSQTLNSEEHHYRKKPGWVQVQVKEVASVCMACCTACCIPLRC
jgi:hypothetical protein